MQIGLQAWGSEGDIQPFAALAAGLVRPHSPFEVVKPRQAHHTVAVSHSFVRAKSIG